MQVSVNEIWQKYSMLLFNEKGKSQDLFLPNDIFKRINSLDIPSTQKAFAFSLYAFVKNTTHKGYCHKISQIKELWGYSPNNKSLNDLVKKDGILDKLGLMRTVIKGIDTNLGYFIEESSTKIQYKEVVYDVDGNKGNFFRVKPEMMLGCISKNQELGPVGFYIYCFICMQCQFKGSGKYEWEHIAVSYISRGLGLSERTVKRYLISLLKHGFILTKKSYKSKGSSNQIYSIYDANRYIPAIECKAIFENQEQDTNKILSAEENKDVVIKLPKPSISNEETRDEDGKIVLPFLLEDDII